MAIAPLQAMVLPYLHNVIQNMIYKNYTQILSRYQVSPHGKHHIIYKNQVFTNLDLKANEPHNLNPKSVTAYNS